MPVYLDHNATSPLHPEVVDAMLPFLRNPPGNPSSLHSYGRMARSVLETARGQVADLVHSAMAGVVGLGKAAGLEIEQRRHYLGQLRDLFGSRLAGMLGSVVFGQSAPRLPNTTYFALPGYHGETLLMELDRAGFALSSGSACHSMVTEPSHVLTAMGIDAGLALNAIRVSFGMSNSLRDVEMLSTKLQEPVNNLPAVFRRAAV